jgi:alpha-1,3-rhamnosyl/mannosyltransferase
VELPGVVSQPDLEDLLASAALVAQPSLEEGFGLPVAEALAAGIPVAMSTAASLVEITRGADVETFDPLSVDAIAAAIDRVAAAPGPVPQLDWPQPVDFAASVLDAMARAELLT